VDRPLFPGKADTLPRPLGLTTTYQLPNFQMQSAFPPGVLVELPPGAKVRPLPGMDQNLPAGKRASDYKLPSMIVLPSGGTVLMFLGFNDDKTAELRKSMQETLDKPIAPPGSVMQVVVANPWIGYSIERKERAQGIAYFFVSEHYNLTLKVEWPRAEARGEALEAVPYILYSVRPDPKAKKIDLFPGAGEEPNGPVPKGTEVAMTNGTRITAHTPSGTIAITAGPGRKRSYTWEGATRSVVMDARSERWYGSLGLYYPGPGDHWKPHRGITRGVVEEGQQHFKTIAEAMRWIREHRYLPLVYRNDGLAVGWSKTPERQQLNVEVWQIYVGGKEAPAAARRAGRGDPGGSPREALADQLAELVRVLLPHDAALDLEAWG
jgi:hypothetical protein